MTIIRINDAQKTPDAKQEPKRTSQKTVRNKFRYKSSREIQINCRAQTNTSNIFSGIPESSIRLKNSTI